MNTRFNQGRYRNDRGRLHSALDSTGSGANQSVPFRPNFGKASGHKSHRPSCAAWHSRLAELPGNWEYFR